MRLPSQTFCSNSSSDASYITLPFYRKFARKQDRQKLEVALYFAMERIFIGTSGWVYKEWANDFYRGLKSKEHFQFYATQFPTVEINATFYRMPNLKTVRGWRNKASKGFIFAVKGSRYITHIKRLNNLESSVGNFIRRIAPMKEKLGPLLWQLPPNFKKDLSRLEKFLKRLPRNFSHAIEFRHPDWICDETFALLRKYNAAFVSMSSMRMPMNFSVTSDFIYIRFHGLAGGAHHDYTREELQPWAKHIREQAEAGKKAFVYFNNDLNVRAPNNAKLLMEMCGDLVVQSFNKAELPLAA
jgi:uncharacterized protein YecE (DUF72 family)